MDAPKKRLPVSDKQRKEVRQYARQNEHLKQHQIATWASREFQRPFTQSMVCKILEDRYAYLDEKSFPRGTTGSSRHLSANNPILEVALYKWHIHMETLKLPVTSAIICKAAYSLWYRMPDFQHLPEPKWSNGWLQGFKKQHRIKQYKQSGEAASADITGSEEEIVRIRGVISNYKSRNVYNTNKTGLFWLQAPDNTLATKAQSGCKKKKNRITLLPTTNANGTHKLDLWIIGHFKNPRPFGRNSTNTQGLPFIEQYNKKA